MSDNKGIKYTYSIREPQEPPQLEKFAYSFKGKVSDPQLDVKEIELQNKN